MQMTQPSFLTALANHYPPHFRRSKLSAVHVCLASGAFQDRPRGLQGAQRLHSTLLDRVVEGQDTWSLCTTHKQSATSRGPEDNMQDVR